MKKIKRPDRLLWAVARFFLRRFAKKVNLKVYDTVSGKLKPPFIVLVNHASVQDYKIDCYVLRKLRPNHVGAYNQFVGKARLLRRLGAIPKRQFVADVSLVKQIKGVLNRKGVFVIYPEAAISIGGGNRSIYPNIAKLVKLLNTPVAVINIKGSYISKPRWKETQRKTDRVEAHFYPLFTETNQMSVEEVLDGIKTALHHNVWEWQKEAGVKNYSQDFLDDAENILYQCPTCLTEFKMHGEGNTITCGECGRKWTIDAYGQFDDGGNIAKWVDFQSEVIRKQLPEYNFSVDVTLETLDDFKGYKQCGEGTLTQTAEGVRYKGTDGTELFFSAEKTPTCGLSPRHVEFSAADNTYKFVMKEVNAAAKVCLGVIETANYNGNL